MADDNDQRISVSREALRAELAELELRLVKYLDDELHEKANKVEVVALKTAVQDKANAIEFQALRHELIAVKNEVFDLSKQMHTQDRINQALRARDAEIKETTASNFTRREKIFAAALGVIALGIQAWSSGVFA